MTVESTFQELLPAAYQDLVAGGPVLEADGHGDKLIALRDGRYLKLFRRKRLFSSALMRPYSRRFDRNARALRDLGILTVAPERLLRIPHLRRTAVLYRPLAWQTLRELLHSAVSIGICCMRWNFSWRACTGGGSTSARCISAMSSSPRPGRSGSSMSPKQIAGSGL
ncbi:MAG: hypothetical protein IPN63_15220 [Gammaproteobacteria bacterium]|nr:hypothetical protein [Gammaproteobacteria bacterium]MBK8132888.1 hypothetical protein [Gammaproteobacteria bacterium]MBK9428674.1 hypothetical protein [Gammaproteobacteria bacterium]